MSVRQALYFLPEAIKEFEKEALKVPPALPSAKKSVIVKLKHSDIYFYTSTSKVKKIQMPFLQPQR